MKLLPVHWQFSQACAGSASTMPTADYQCRAVSREAAPCAAPCACRKVTEPVGRHCREMLQRQPQPIRGAEQDVGAAS